MPPDSPEREALLILRCWSKDGAIHRLRLSTTYDITTNTLTEHVLPTPEAASRAITTWLDGLPG